MLYSFREGNRSELLADYLLSSIGITTPIRRQDDFGFDFYCHLANDDDNKYLTFGFPFIIQIKSNSSTSILYGDKDPNHWRIEKVDWLFRNEIPFLIGIVDKQNISIKIYDTTGLWQLFKNGESQNCSQVELVPKSHPYKERRENRDRKKIDNWVDNKGDGYKYIIDLGNPIIDITYNDLQKPEREALKEKKNILRRFIIEEQINIRHRNLGVNGFNEFKQNTTNSAGYIETGMELRGGNPEDVNNIYASFRTGLISLFMTLFAQERNEEFSSLINFLKHIPPAYYYKQLYDQRPNLFYWMIPILLKETFTQLLEKFSSDKYLVNKFWKEIETNYSKNGRHYHTLPHLLNMLDQLMEVKTEIKDSDAILFALYYHDIIYNALKTNNEEKSAELAVKRLKTIAVSANIIEKCRDIILATKKHLQSTDNDINIFTDADLSVLGQDWTIYETYLKQIRKEYSVYPDIIYNPGRKKVLEHFLKMERIYKTEYFFDKFEAQAKENLKKELKQMLAQVW